VGYKKQIIKHGRVLLNWAC